MTAPILTVIAALFALGGLLVLAAGRLGAGPEAAAELRRLYRIQVVIVLPPLLFGILPFWTAVCLLVTAAVRGIWELEGTRGATSHPWFGHLLLLAVLAGMGFLHRQADGAALVIFAYVVVESADSFALLFGRLFGRHHPFPRLSPGKTAEGLVGGLIAGALVGTALGHWALGWSAAETATICAVTLGGGLAGDWLTSAYKRVRGRKDFPPLYILHGGLLDIYDSFLGAGLALSLMRLA